MAFPPVRKSAPGSIVLPALRHYTICEGSNTICEANVQG